MNMLRENRPSRQVLVALRRIMQAVDSHSRRLMQRTGLSVPQILVLQALESGGEPIGTGALAERLLGAPDPVVMLFALVGLFGGLFWLGRRGSAAAEDTRFRPVILRKDPSAAEHCARLDRS